MSPNAADILKRFPSVPAGALTPLGNHGGFSGARLWRLETSAGNFAVKAWPKDWRSPEDLAWIHRLITQAAVHAWMPRAMPTDGGATFVASEDRLWEVLTWMPGASDFAQAPSNARLEAVATALAQLHQTWAANEPRTEACPAARRRLESFQTWKQLLETGWRPAFAPLDPYQANAERLFQIVGAKIDVVPMMLSAWVNRQLPVQPCACDLWHDHVLFSGDTVSGVIDFGSVKFDHVTVDLARLFGSLIGGDDPAWKVGLAAYEKIRPLSLTDKTLARVLDRTGVLLAAANWLRWLYHEGRIYPDPAAVNGRLEVLVRRLGTN
jgi:Ser/Thr protein kinase RdoA (MazF antagonist)